MNRESIGRGDLKEVFTFYTVITAQDNLTNAEIETLVEAGTRWGRFEWLSGRENYNEGRNVSLKRATIEADAVTGMTEKHFIKRNNTGKYFEIITIEDDEAHLTSYLVEQNDSLQD